MRSGVRFWGATTITLVASGAANSADLEPAVQLRPALWSWSGGYIGGHAGGGYGLKSLSNPCGPSVYGGGGDTPVFLAGGQIGYNWQKNSWVFGLKLKASSAVSKGTNTRLAASGIVASANCKAGPNVFVTGAGRLGYAFGAGPHAGLPQGRRSLAKQLRRRHRRVWPMSATARSTSTRCSTRSFPAHATMMLGAKTVNVLDKVPLSEQATMKKDLREIYWARAQRPPKRRPTSSSRSFARSTAGRSNAWSRIATHCWPSRIFLPKTLGLT